MFGKNYDDWLEEMTIKRIQDSIYKLSLMKDPLCPQVSENRSENPLFDNN